MGRVRAYLLRHSRLRVDHLELELKVTTAAGLEVNRVRSIALPRDAHLNTVDRSASIRLQKSTAPVQKRRAE